MRTTTCLFLYFSIQALLFGGDSFRLFVPDPKSQQLKAYSMQSNASGLVTKAAVLLKLSFSPNSIAIDPKRDSLILTGASDGKPMSATAAYSENGGLKLVLSLIHI